MEQHSFFIFCAFRYHLLPTTYEIADDVATTDKVSITWTNYQLTNIISFLMLRIPVTKITITQIENILTNPLPV